MVLQVSTGNAKLKLLRLNCAVLCQKHNLAPATISLIPQGFQVHLPAGADVNEWARMLHQGFGNVHEASRDSVPS